MGELIYFICYIQNKICITPEAHFMDNYEMYVVFYNKSYSKYISLNADLVPPEIIALPLQPLCLTPS